MAVERDNSENIYIPYTKKKKGIFEHAHSVRAYSYKSTRDSVVDLDTSVSCIIVWESSTYTALFFVSLPNLSVLPKPMGRAMDALRSISSHIV